MRPRQRSFEHFYLTRVALGDCCGCAERVIDWRDIEHASDDRLKLVDNVASRRKPKGGVLGKLPRLRLRIPAWLRQRTPAT